MSSHFTFNYKLLRKTPILQVRFYDETIVLSLVALQLIIMQGSINNESKVPEPDWLDSFGYDLELLLVGAGLSLKIDAAGQADVSNGLTLQEAFPFGNGFGWNEIGPWERNWTNPEFFLWFLCLVLDVSLYQLAKIMGLNLTIFSRMGAQILWKRESFPFKTQLPVTMALAWVNLSSALL